MHPTLTVAEVRASLSQPISDIGGICWGFLLWLRWREPVVPGIKAKAYARSLSAGPDEAIEAEIARYTIERGSDK